MPSTLEKLFNNLSSDGYQLGSFDDFKRNLSDSTKANKLYNNLISDGYQLGSWDNFAEKIGRPWDDVATQSQQTGQGAVQQQAAPAQEADGQEPTAQAATPDGGTAGSSDEGKTVQMGSDGTFTLEQMEAIDKGARPVMAPNTPYRMAMQEQQPATPPSYGTPEWMDETIVDEMNPQNPYAGMTRRQAVEELGRRYYGQLGKGQQQLVLDENGQRKPQTATPARTLIETALANGIITNPSEGPRLATDVRNSYIERVAQDRVRKLLGNITGPVNRDTFEELFNNEEIRNDINKDLQSLGMGEYSHMYDADMPDDVNERLRIMWNRTHGNDYLGGMLGESRQNNPADTEAQRRATQDYLNTRDAYYGLLKKKLEEELVNNYGYRSAGGISSVTGLIGDAQYHDYGVEHQAVDKALQEHFAPAVEAAFAKGDKAADEVIDNELSPISYNINTAAADATTALRKANEARDPDKLLKDLQGQVNSAAIEMLNDENLLNEIWQGAARSGQDINQYIEDHVAPQLMESLRKRFEQTAIERELPKSTIDYVLRGLTDDSILGMLHQMATMTEGQRRYRGMANDQSDASVWAQAGRLAAGMASDFWLWGGWGKIGNRAAGELLTQRMSSLATQKGITMSAARRLLEEEGRQYLGKDVVSNLMSHIPQSAVTMSGAMASGELVKNVNRGENVGTALENAFRAGVSGAAVGTAFGLTGGAVNPFVSRAPGGIFGRTLAKFAATGVEAGTMYTTEELERLMSGDEDAFKNPFEGLLDASIKLGAIKLSNPGSLMHEIASVTKGNKPLLSKADLRDLQESTGGRRLIDAITQLRPARSTDPDQRMGYINPEKAAEAAQAYRNYMTDPDKPWERRQKVAHLLGGIIPPVGHEVSVEVIPAGETDGRTIVKTRNIDGQCVREMEYDSPEQAQAEVEKMQADIINNNTLALAQKINMYDSYQNYGQYLEEEYQRAAQKLRAGEELTDGERQAVYLHQHRNELPFIQDKINNGVELSAEEQQLGDLYMNRFEDYVKSEKGSDAFIREFEEQQGLPEGFVQQILDIDPRGRTETEERFVESFHEAMRQRIAEYEHKGEPAPEPAGLLEGGSSLPTAPGMGAEGADGGEPPAGGTAWRSGEPVEGEAFTVNGETWYAQQFADGWKMVRQNADGSVSVRPLDEDAYRAYKSTTPSLPEGEGGEPGGGASGAGTADVATQSQQTGQGAGQGPADIVSPRRQAAYQRGTDAGQNKAAMAGIGYDTMLADARMMALFPASDPVAARRRQDIVKAIDAGDDEAADKLIGAARPYLSAEQLEAIEQYRDMAETRRAVDEMIAQQSAAFSEKRKQELQRFAAPDGTITPLTLNDGSVVYYLAGNLNNAYGGVMAVTRDGENRQIPMSFITNVGRSNSVDTLVADEVNAFAAQLDADYDAYLNGRKFDNGQQVQLSVAGRLFDAVVTGTDAAGNVLFTLSDGSQMPMSADDASKAIADADRIRIEQQLRQEKESVETQRQTERFGKGIAGYAEGKADLTAAGNDAKAVAEFLTSQQPDGGTAGHSKVMKAVGSESERLALELARAQDEYEQARRAYNMYSFAEDGTPEKEEALAKSDAAYNRMQDIRRRQRKLGEVRMELMTPEERTKYETARTKAVNKQLAASRKELAGKPGGEAAGTMDAVPTGKELLDKYQEQGEAADAVEALRKETARVWREELYPQLATVREQLSDYQRGLSELSDAEVKALTDQLAQLEIQESALIKRSNDLKALDSSLGRLYASRNKAAMTPHEQKLAAMEKETDKQKKLKLAREAYADDEMALAELENIEPQDVYEWIADHLGKGSLNWEGMQRGEHYVRGVSDMLGKDKKRGIGKQYDTNGINYFLAPEGQGKGFDEVAHVISESSPYDSIVVSNALEEMLRSASKPTDITNRIIDDRIQRANDVYEENYRRMMEEAEREESQSPTQTLPEENPTQTLPEGEGEKADGEAPGTEAGTDVATRSQQTGQGGNDFPARLAEANKEVAMNPTDGQKEAGNYKKGHLEFGGYKYTIENPRYSVRSGVDANGKRWDQVMQDTYGYIRGKRDADGDHIDMFINDDADLDKWNGRVFVVDQGKPDGEAPGTLAFDEHKVMYGYNTWTEAKRAYERNYPAGWWDSHVMQMMGVKKADFDKWLADSERKTKPFAEYFRVQNAEPVYDPVSDMLATVEERKGLTPTLSEREGEKPAGKATRKPAGEAAGKVPDTKAVQPSYKAGELEKRSADELRQLKKRREKDLSTSRYILKAADVKPNTEKARLLNGNIAQAQADIAAINAELERKNAEAKLRAEQQEIGGAMVDQLENMGFEVSTNPAENRRTLKAAQKDNSEEGKLRHFETPDGKIYGFTYKGKMYLDPTKIDAELPIHEYAHPWCEAFRRLNPEGWKEIVGLMKGDKDTWEFVKQLNPDLKDENDIAEEMIAKYSGKRGQERAEAEYKRMNGRDADYKSKWGNIWKNISKAIQDFWKNVGDFLHIKYKSAEQVYDQVVGDFANKINPRKRVEDWLKERDKSYVEAVESGDEAKAKELFDEALRENIGNGMTPFIAAGGYRGKMQRLAHGVKSRNPKVIAEVADLMAPMIPKDAVLVPAPSHSGDATDMLDLANAISERTGAPVADVLKSGLRGSQYEAKKAGKPLSAQELGIIMQGELPEDKIPVVIDNVVDSGNTAEACVRALGKGIVASLAESKGRFRHVASLKSAEPVVIDKSGDVVPLSERFDFMIEGNLFSDKDFEEEENRLETQREQQQAADVVQMPRINKYGLNEATPIGRKLTEVKMQGGPSALAAYHDTDTNELMFFGNDVQTVDDNMKINGHRATVDGMPSLTVPYKQLDTISPRLVKNGYKLGIVDDKTEDPAENPTEKRRAQQPEKQQAQPQRAQEQPEPLDAVDSMLREVERRKEVADKNTAKKTVDDYLAEKAKGSEIEKVRVRATKAVLKALDNAGVPYDVVSKQEEREMMKLFSMMNEEAVKQFARRPDIRNNAEHGRGRYIVYNMEDPFGMPMYAEKMSVARWIKGDVQKYGGTWKILDIGEPGEAVAESSAMKKAAEMQAELHLVAVTKDGETVQFMVEYPEPQGTKAPTFYSNAERAVEGIRQEKATPEQWLKMIEKGGGLKAGEDKWIGLSDWLREQQAVGKKSLTKQEVLDYIRENQIEVQDVNYAENAIGELPAEAQAKLKAFNKEFQEFVDELAHEHETELDDGIIAYEDIADMAMDKMVEEYGADFREAFDYEGNRRGKWDLVPARYDTEEPKEETARFLGLNIDYTVNPINETRLGYTTDGLQNKREIALVVPTVEPYNEYDNIHFGGAGGGRAVAWVRFGEVELDENGNRVYDNHDDFVRAMQRKYDGKTGYALENAMTEEERQTERSLIDGTYQKPKNTRKVLVIDEIQSKRHQEGREKGYVDEGKVKNLKKEYEAKKDELQEAYEKLDEFRYQNGEIFDSSKEYDILENEIHGIEKRMRELEEELKLAKRANMYGVPDAPFEKNWHELAMKRMLRYAAENGYDKVAWTKGEQQAERYNISRFVNKIEREDSKFSNERRFSLRYNDGSDVNENLFVNNDGVVVDAARNKQFVGKTLAEIFGKEAAAKMMQMEDGTEMSPKDLVIGGEGMKGFYDQMLPRFMDKYGKKWGVKTGEIELPNVEEAGRRMWSVDVTPEMKESVMQGQPMFQKEANGIMGWSDSKGVHLTHAGLNPNTPIHEITHLWDRWCMLEQPELWKKVVWAMKQTKMWEEIKKNPNYRNIWDDEDRMASEVHSRLSGAEGEELFTKASFKKGTSQKIIDEVKGILRKFWDAVLRLFGKQSKTFGDDMASYDAIVRMPIKDLVNQDFEKVMNAVAKSPVQSKFVDRVTNVVRKDGQVEFNVTTFRDEKEQMRNLFVDAGWSEEEADGMMQFAEDVSKQLEQMAKDFPHLAAFSEMAANKNRQIFRSNPDYAGSFDYSFDCVKKEATDYVVSRMIEMGKASHLGTTQIEAIRRILSNHGYLTPCVMCYVEGKRKIMKQAKESAQRWNAVADAVGLGDTLLGDAVELTKEQMHLLRGLSNGENLDMVDGYGTGADARLKPDTIRKIATLMLNNPELRGRFNHEWLMTKEGYSQLSNRYASTGLMSYLNTGQYKGKGLLDVSPFSLSSIRNDMLEALFAPIRWANEGGVRQFSYEDARPELFFDYYQQMMLLHGARAPLHLYTKRPFYPDLFGETGAMINQSLIVDVWKGSEGHRQRLGLDEKQYDQWLRDHAGFIPKSELEPSADAAGTVADDELVPYYSKDSFPVEQAMQNVHEQRFGGRVGNVVVAPSDEFIRWALDNPDVHMILPYHAKGASRNQRSLTGYDLASAYDNDYLTMKDGKAVTIDDKSNNIVIQGGQLKWNMLLRAMQREGKGAREAAAFYADYCRKNGLTPAFERFADHPEYYKLLTDFRMYDDAGNVVKQRPVDTRLPADWSEKLRGYLGEEETRKGDVEAIGQDEALNKELQQVTKYASIEGEERKQVEKILTDIYGKDNVFIMDGKDFDEALDKATEEGKASMLRDSGGIVYGFTKNGKIYLANDLFNAHTPLHEHTHIYMHVMEKKNPRLHQRGVELWKETERWQQVREHLESLGEEDPSDSRILSELVSQFTGNENEQVISEITGITDKNWLKRAVEWLRELWDGVKSAFSRWTDKDLQGLTREQFASMPMKAFYDKAERERYIKNLRDLDGIDMATDMESDQAAMHIVTDKDEVKRLDKEPKEVGYRNVVLNDDGTLGSPMASKLGKKGEKSKATTPFEFGKWERSDEHPELATENGKIDLIKPDGLGPVGGVDYNPYIHIRPTTLNKQFKNAWERPNLVYIETEYPKSELDGGYRAEKAAKAVGRHPWGGGELILSRWDKPVRIVPWEEVAPEWIAEYKDKGVNFDIVPPKLLPILVENGVEILPPHKNMGKDCVAAYERFLEEKEQGTIDVMSRRGTPKLIAANSAFNKRLEELDKDRNQKNRVLHLGHPGIFLRAGKIDDGEIVMDFDSLLRKANPKYKHDHPFTPGDVKDLPLAINYPIAVFATKSNGDKTILTELKKDGKNFIVVIRATEQQRKGGVALKVNEIETLFPKDAKGVVKWILDNKATNIDKEKALQWIEALQTHPETTNHEELNSAAKVVKDFELPKLSEEKIREIYPEYTRAGDDTAEKLGGVKVVWEQQTLEPGTKGWYDPNTNTVHVAIDEVEDVADVKRTVTHEKLGHEGLVALMGSQDEVNKFGQFAFRSAGKKLRERILNKADEEGYEWNDPLRLSKAAQEVIGEIAEDGPATAEEFSLWQKVKHYLARLLNKLGLRIPGLLNDHDLRYYILKTAEALKKRPIPSPEGKGEDLSRQATSYDIMRSRKGKPRKRNDESMAQYLERLKEWERWKLAEEKAAANNDPMPEKDKIDQKWEEQFNRDMDEWKRRNGIGTDETGPGAFPKREPDESPQDYAIRVADYESKNDIWKGRPDYFDYMRRAQEDYYELYGAWKERYNLQEAENVDMEIYEGRGGEGPQTYDDLDVEQRVEQEMAESLGVQLDSEGAKRHAKLALIDRRKNLESSNAEDAIWIHDLFKKIDEVAAGMDGVTGKQLREALPFIIEGTYWQDILRDENGEVVSIEDISDQMPIKKTPELEALLSDIKEWYDNFFQALEEAGLRYDAGYIPEGYVNHIWDKEKSDPKAWEKYIENYQRTKSPNMRHREIETYELGISLGLVPKFKDITDIIAYYSRSNNEALANKKFLDDMSFICVQQLNSDGEIVANLPLLNSEKPDALTRDSYVMYNVPGVGDVWVLKDVQKRFANVFGTMRTQDAASWLSKLGKAYDITGSTAKKIQLALSGFHALALWEVDVAQSGPMAGLHDLFKYIVIDSFRKDTIPAYAHPEDFKFAASHLVQLGATEDYAAADVNGITASMRKAVEEWYKSDALFKKAAGAAGSVPAILMDWINQGFDKVLWNYLHDGLKICAFKRLADQVEKRVRKEGLDDDTREKLLDEAGQYVNDMFGGQWWELLNVSPATLKWLRRALLSPDWLVSTQRHFLANAGIGSLYSDGGWREYLRYNWDNIKRAVGANIPHDELRRFRSMNAKRAYLIGALFFWQLVYNAFNALNRWQDEQNEKEKAEEIRKTNPEYKSPYELIYPDGMKWYDYLMWGNSIGQQTHLFSGRYADGTETYVRWGKQFREFPELFIGRHGFEFPTPILERMQSKANPAIGSIIDMLGSLDMRGFEESYQNKELREKYGKTIATLATTAQHFIPFGVPTQADKEYKWLDFFMPSSKGFSRYKAVDYFQTFILAGDMRGVEQTYNAAVMNGVDAEACLKSAISTIKATQRKELRDGVADLQTAMAHFDASDDITEKRVMKNKIVEYLTGSQYRLFAREEAMEQVTNFLNGNSDNSSDGTVIGGKKNNDRYLFLSNSSDVRADWQLSQLKKQAKGFSDEIKAVREAGDAARASELASEYASWLGIKKVIGNAERAISNQKKLLNTGHDDEVMQEIRRIREDAMRQIEQLQEPQ